MKEFIIYRNKETNKITNIHEANEKCTEERIVKYNNNEKYDSKVEKITLEEDSPAYFLWNMKYVSRNELYDELLNIRDIIGNLSSRIDYKLDELEDLCKEKE